MLKLQFLSSYLAEVLFSIVMFFRFCQLHVHVLYELPALYYDHRCEQLSIYLYGFSEFYFRGSLETL